MPSCSWRLRSRTISRRWCSSTRRCAAAGSPRPTSPRPAPSGDAQPGVMRAAMAATAQRTWWQRPNRVLLINLREGDEARIDPDKLIEEVQGFSATAFCINGGGIVAFYQTQIAGHPKSAGLNGRDLL